MSYQVPAYILPPLAVPEYPDETSLKALLARLSRHKAPDKINYRYDMYGNTDGCIRWEGRTSFQWSDYVLFF